MNTLPFTGGNVEPEKHTLTVVLPPPAQPVRLPTAPVSCLPTREHAAWNVVIHFGKNEGRRLCDLSENSREWYFDTWLADRERNPTLLKGEDQILFHALYWLAHEKEVPQTEEAVTDSPQEWFRLEGQVHAVRSGEGTRGHERLTFHVVEIAAEHGIPHVLGTLDEKLAHVAKAAQGDGTPVVASYRPGRKVGSFELMDLVTRGPDDAFEAVAVSDPDVAIL